MTAPTPSAGEVARAVVALYQGTLPAFPAWVARGLEQAIMEALATARAEGAQAERARIAQMILVDDSAAPGETLERVYAALAGEATDG